MSQGIQLTADANKSLNLDEALIQVSTLSQLKAPQKFDLADMQSLLEARLLSSLVTQVRPYYCVRLMRILTGTQRARTTF